MFVSSSCRCVCSSAMCNDPFPGSQSVSQMDIFAGLREFKEYLDDRLDKIENKVCQ